MDHDQTRLGELLPDQQVARTAASRAAGAERDHLGHGAHGLGSIQVSASMLERWTAPAPAPCALVGLGGGFGVGGSALKY
ncbi:MAG: hypothetical protein U1F77_09380 [Kiritimatiellia bacterium]